MSGGRRAGHDATTYERPTQPYVCGRASLWRKACWQGPGLRGECGGAFECIPVRSGDRWECRRPRQAGGRCSDGPLPTGSCSHRHAPCAPVTGLRRLRARVSLVALLALVVVLIVGPDPTARTAVNAAALDAGRLSSVHAGFTREQGCAACHASHAKDAWGWFAAAFSSNDPSARCADCHGFAGETMRAHNGVHSKRGEAPLVSCVRCHTEHQGAEVKIARVRDYVCASCHEKSFSDFPSGHPQFAARYPYAKPGAINFDHTKHINQYFAEPKYARRSPKFAAAARTQCTACHAVESATREVRPKPYAEICAGCHEAQIQKARLVLLEPERLTPAVSMLLGVQKDGDEAEASKRLVKLWDAMSRSGTEALSELLGGRDAGTKKRAGALFEGLATPTAQSVGATWVARRTLKPAEDDAPAGWAAGETADGQALFYTPRGHGDAVVRAWLEYLRTGTKAGDEQRTQIAADALEQFLDKDTGPGACGTCHGAALRSATPDKLAAAWHYAGAEARPFIRYSHAPHLGLLDPAAGCRSCHELNPSARYAKYHSASSPKPDAYESNFVGMKKETCATCHSEGHVDAACQVCHNYHAGHQLNLGFRQKDTKGMTNK